jgi:hypothetical protein
MPLAACFSISHLHQNNTFPVVTFTWPLTKPLIGNHSSLPSDWHVDTFKYTF